MKQSNLIIIVNLGEGIYAFKCRHAENLFQTLQSYIQMSSVGDLPNSNSMLAPVDASSPISTLSNPNSGPNNMGSYILPNSRSSNTNTLRNETTDSNYLEPLATSNLLTHFNTMADGTASSQSMEPLSPGSPNNILEVTPLNPLSNTGLNNNGVSNLYQEFVLRGNKDTNREQCVKKLSLDVPPQEYAPTAGNFATGIDTNIDANTFIGNRELSSEYLSQSLPISPSQSNETNDIPMYMNIAVGDLSSTASTPKMLFGNLFYRNNFNNNYLVDPTHCYENLEPNDIRLLRTQHRRFSRTEILSKADSFLNSPTIISENISEPSTPSNSGNSGGGNGSVNYIVLDLDQSHHSQSIVPISNISANGENSASFTSPSSSPIKNVPTIATNSMSPCVSASTTTHSVSSLLLPDSPQHINYAAIDFIKTNAFFQPATEPVGSRRTRHCSNISPNILLAVNANSPSSQCNSIRD